MPDPTSTVELTYGSYLELDPLLRLQRPASTPEHPDELHFIVTHQAMELWFKVMIHELHRVLLCLAERRWSRSVTRLRRLNAILAAQIAQMTTLNTLEPGAFLEFRPFLGTASGFQSVQFRVIEVLSGLREPGYLAELAAASGGTLPTEVADALAVPSLADLAVGAPGAAGAEDWYAVYTDPERHAALVLLGEELLDHDRMWLRWRHEHLCLVERMIGRLVRGTGGGSSGYLEGRASQRIFPFLWELRRQLTLSTEKEPRD
jgi:tryptophan 2,3-dioxygenase